ncbi:hypothetical protein DFQ09_101275 [Winogradskyella pacifica]|uniref:Glycosyltransferase involved in cell wall biosynthesis n=1 Tax=Winogradskyella pacifica TaxID=664642 RepID=A0A3D9N5T2_9FLAO|nr:hypothetical protein [Winogradskyella pacifica]REE27444.1 hypothetical protein DFQ09_101275 [Winogradskyella pacifica]
MKKIAVIHYMPIEYYPPTTNFLDVVSNANNIKLKVWTTHNTKNRKEYKSEKFTTIIRTILPNSNSNGFVRLLQYFLFNLKCLFGLLFFRPSKIVYFESFSVWPVYIYKRFFNQSVEILIHYHEYFSPHWYIHGMRLVNYYHKLETRFLYSKAYWISQTNQDRMNLFLKDHPMINSAVCEILPNYPPLNWSIKRKKMHKEKPLRTVYIGTLSLDYSYIKEYCNWVISKNGDILFDIYGYNYNVETLEYLNSIKSKYINFYDSGVEYQEIPDLLNSYDIGLILYKALTENFKYNAPNKLFEYLVCNLQVWYSNKMLGIRTYAEEDVVSIDFENIPDFNYDNVVFKGKEDKKHVYIANQALRPLIKSLIK